MNNYIKEKRKSMKFTQTQLAKKSNLTKKSVYFIEKGEDFKVSTLYKLAKALEVEPEEIIKELKNRRSL